ncbi:uncharacterized protein LOC127788771 isoform X2 [Diospyros lotus]|uniref:uncharacterized protein LOC127788771 isoform X2 n=1 Tax=Diospyros lotus TaxID=55363 RepID=UPI00224E33BB|nr:uncharacterized protein LOC127788771 isoform X2 [Diospyros lotus]
MCDSVSSVTLPLLSYSAIGSSNSRFSTSNCMPPGARSLQVFSCSSDRNGGCRLTGACFRWDGAGPNTAKSASSLKASRNPIPSGSSEYDLYGKLGFKEKEKEEIGLGTEQRIEKQKRGSEIDQFSVNFVEFNEETGANSVERLEDEDLVKTEEGNDGFDSKLEECEQSDVIKGPIATRKGRQVMRRSNLVAKQVIGLQSALSLGFVSQLWVDTVSWLALVVEVRPTLFSGEVDRFFLEDVSQVGDVVLIHDDCLMENELQIVGLETLVGYNVVTPGQQSIGKVRGYTFNINSGAVESLEFDSFGISIIPSSLVSTYKLLVEDVMEVVSDTVVVHEAAALRIQRLTKGFWDSQNSGKSIDEFRYYSDLERQPARYDQDRARARDRPGSFTSRKSRRREARRNVDDWELPMDYL